jgi:2-hydroxychromene-2-carboxylate isomerase
MGVRLAEARENGKATRPKLGYIAAMTTAPTLDFWFEFASTYSYPAAMRIGGLAKASGVAVRRRPFLLGPIFKELGWTTSPFNVYEAKGRYMWRDLERTCEALGLPFAKPSLFPQNTLLAARVATLALEQDWGEDFCRAVYRAEFCDGQNIGEPEVIAQVLKNIGQDADAIIAQAQSDKNKSKLRANTEEAGKRGIFGAPSFVTSDGELFWGNDRLEAAIAWAKR